MKLNSIRWTCITAIIILLAMPSVSGAEKPAGLPLSAEDGYSPYRVGEVLEYSVSWSKFMVAASMTAKVKERRVFNNYDSYHVVMEAATVGLAGLVYEATTNYESYVKADTLLPFQAQNSLQQPKRVKKRQYKLDHDNGQAVLHDGRTIPIPPSTHDVASLFYAIRSMDLALKKTAQFTLIENDKLQQLVAVTEGFEDVETEAGTFRTARIAVKFEKDGVICDSRKLRIYLSHDSKRRPVLITADLPLGSIRVELVSAR